MNAPLWTVIQGRYTSTWYVVRDGVVLYSTRDELAARRWCEHTQKEYGE